MGPADSTDATVSGTHSVRRVVGSADDLGWSAHHARARLGATLFGTEVQPMLPRYELCRAIGRGAMGEVWEAFDPELRRAVAIKLLLPAAAGSATASARMAREARSLARLSDPNVVAVFDVGEYRVEDAGGTFIVMELVEGEPLSRWMGRPHRWSEIVEVFVACASGLAAAHDVGLVHRDFKPSNVLMGRDGRARVGDFGLARLADGARAQALPNVDDGAELADTLAGDLTETGVVLGTPLYMAPEQHHAAAATPRSDQYAFCVALWEALHGTPPFRGSVHAVAAAKDEGRLPETDRRRMPWPSRLDRAIARGLDPVPERRWASMRALAAELRAIGSTRRVGARALLAGAVVLGAIGWANDRDDCEAMGQGRDRWGPGRSAALSEQLEGTLEPDAAARTVTAIGDWASSLTLASQAACRADPARATRRWECLDAAADQLDAVGQRIDDGSLDGAQLVALVHDLPDPDRCAEQVAPSAISEAARAQAAEMRQALVQAHVTGNAGERQAALAMATSVRDALLASDDDASGLAALLPWARFEVAAALWELSLVAEAEAEFEASYFAARVQRDPVVELQAAARLATLTGSQYRPRDASQWLAHADAASLAEPLDGSGASALGLARGLVAFYAGDDVRAMADLRAAIAACDAARCARTQLSARENLATALHRAGQDDASASMWREALAQATELYGPRSPASVSSRIGLATALVDVAPHESLAHAELALAAIGDAATEDALAFAQASEVKGRALRILGNDVEAYDAFVRGAEIAPRGDARLIAALLSGAAGAAVALGRADEARARYDEALERVPVEDVRNHLALRVQRGVLRFEQGDFEGGDADHREALRLVGELPSPDPATLALIQANRGEALALAHRCEEAIARYDDAIAAVPADAPEAAVYRAARARCVAGLAVTPPAVAAAGAYRGTR